MPEIRITVAVEEPRRYVGPEELYSKSVVVSEELAGLWEVRDAIARATVRMIDEALGSFQVPASPSVPAVEPISADDAERVAEEAEDSQDALAALPF